MPAPPRRFLTRALLAAVLGFAAAFAVACGSSGSGKGLLSAAESRTISSALDAVSSAVRAHSCSRAKTAVNALDASLDHLSQGTSAKLVQNLGHGASTVSQLALTQCAPRPQTTTSTTSTTATATTTTPPVTTTTTAPATTPSVPTTSSNPATTPGTTPSTPTPGTTPSTPAPGPGNGTGNGPGGGGAGGGAGLGGQGSQ